MLSFQTGLYFRLYISENIIPFMANGLNSLIFGGESGSSGQTVTLH